MWHNAYINDVFNTLSEQLPAGYEVGMTTSLQISEYHPDKVAKMGDEIRAVAERKSKQINVAYTEALKHVRE